jgi:hypothetical protein
MGCSACSAKNQSQTALNAFRGMSPKKLKSLRQSNPKPCKYTFEQISERFDTETNARHKNYLKNALVNYSKNCNLFNRQLDKIFI